MKYFIFLNFDNVNFFPRCYQKTIPGFTLLGNVGIRVLKSMANFVT